MSLTPCIGPSRTGILVEKRKKSVVYYLNAVHFTGIHYLSGGSALWAPLLSWLTFRSQTLPRYWKRGKHWKMWQCLKCHFWSASLGFAFVSTVLTASADWKGGRPGVVLCTLAPIAALEDVVLFALKRDFVTHIHRPQGTKLTIYQHRVGTVAHWRRKQAVICKGQDETHRSKH